MGDITQKHLAISFASHKHICGRTEVMTIALSFLPSSLPPLPPFLPPLISLIPFDIQQGQKLVFVQAPHFNQKNEEGRNPTANKQLIRLCCFGSYSKIRKTALGEGLRIQSESILKRIQTQLQGQRSFHRLHILRITREK